MDQPTESFSIAFVAPLVSTMIYTHVLQIGARAAQPARRTMKSPALHSGRHAVEPKMRSSIPPTSCATRQRARVVRSLSKSSSAGANISSKFA